MVKNKILEITSKITYDKLEDLLAKLNHAPVEVDIKIPVKLNYREFGVLPGVLLVMFTWVRCKKGKLIIPIKKENQEGFKEFVLDYFGYVVVTTVWRHCEIVNEEFEPIKPYFQKHTGSMHKYLQFLADELPNDSVLVPCLDHYSEEKGLPHWFYSGKFLFKETPSELDLSVYRLVSKISTTYKSRLAKNIMGSIDDLTNIIWELLKNTDEHAKTDYLNDVKLLPNTRGLFMQIQRSSKKRFIENTQHQGLKKYYSSAIDDNDFSFILEISIFDSGPGLVKRFLGEEWTENISISQEVETVKKCLIKGRTSVKSVEGDKKGFGLDAVLRLLSSRRGFLKIRTGKVSVYRDLILSPYRITEKPDEVDLYDWTTNKSSAFQNQEKVEGTQITLAYPLNS